METKWRCWPQRSKEDVKNAVNSATNLLIANQIQTMQMQDHEMEKILCVSFVIRRDCFKCKAKQQKKNELANVTKEGDCRNVYVAGS